VSKLLQRLRDPARSGVYRASAAQPIEEATRGSALDVVTIDAGASVLDAMARALDFPDWFGGNWDALEDCLLDLSWSKAGGWVLIFKSFAGLPPDDLGVLTDVLGSTAEYWAGRGRLFFAVFVDPQRALGLPDLYKEK